jgi:hypothetical protein
MSEISTEEGKRWTYKTDEAVYDVSLLNEEAQLSFSYLAEVELEVQSLAKRIDILRAAGASLNNVLQSSLIEEAVIERVENEEDTNEKDN